MNRSRKKSTVYSNDNKRQMSCRNYWKGRCCQFEMGGQHAVVELFVSGSTNAHSTNTNNCDHMPLFSYAELCRNDP